MKCLVCNALCELESDYLHWGWPAVRIFDKLKILTCCKCGFSFLKEEIPTLELNYFYNFQYRAKGAPFFWDYDLPYQTPNIFPARSVAQIYLAGVFSSFTRGDIFLDIGAGPGDSLFCAINILDSPKCYVIEPNIRSAKYYERNFKAISITSLQEMCEKKILAKIILLSHTLEHFRATDLPILLKSLKGALDKGGALVIEVPHVDFNLHKEIRFPDTPHTIFFSADSLCRLLKNYGFDIRHIQILGNSYPYEFLPKVLNQIEQTGRTDGYFKKILSQVGLKSITNRIKRFLKHRRKNIDLNIFNDFKNNSALDTIRVVVTHSNEH
jgi:hypothetical protein